MAEHQQQLQQATRERANSLHTTSTTSVLDSSRPFDNPLFREIHKSTWLKRINKGASDSKRPKKQQVWAVFCVHDDTAAYLEFYFDNLSAVLHKPLWHTCLNTARHVSPTICAHDQDYEFVITLASEVVRLAAPTWDAMLDWVESLRGKLQELKILTPKENLYTKAPEGRCGTPLLPTRDPTSPLPPPPEVPPALPPGVEPVNHNRRPTPRALEHNENVFNFEQLADATPDNAVVSLATTTAAANGYEPLFTAPAASPGPSNLQYLAQQQQQQPPPATRPTEPYLTLREHQVMQLQKEIEHPGGVRLRLRRKDCTNCIAFVDAYAAVWVCGWKMKENPMLYNVLHIGDQLLSIDGCTMRNTGDVQRVLRRQPQQQQQHVHVVVQRVPHGRVLVIHRDADGQPLGIAPEAGTAVIADVLPDGLAARHGLTARAPATCDAAGTTNWVLTEINGRPLNLFCKDHQVKDRLNAVGRDISILVQPLDLVKQFKKQLKTLKNYKDYLLH